MRTKLVTAVVDPKMVSHLSEMTLKFVGVRLSRSDAERPAALGSEAKRNADGRAQYNFSLSHRIPSEFCCFIDWLLVV